MSFEKKRWRVNDDLTAKEMNDLEERIEGQFDWLNPEIVNNNNGTYIKFPNGLLICMHWERRRDVDMSVPMHSLYREDGGYIWNYPHKFKERPSLSIEALSGLGNGKYISGNNPEYATYRSTATVAVKRDVEFSYLAIGFWK